MRAAVVRTQHQKSEGATNLSVDPIHPDFKLLLQLAYSAYVCVCLMAIYLGSRETPPASFHPFSLSLSLVFCCFDFSPSMKFVLKEKNTNVKIKTN
ncbi:hypothetical protein QBC43DRAFT_119026 [Cladorrhinum sp. PSN259]|nr:hypothetical protein QBC43DRAFT_119026 [Cladorrhinum sp. PSN259]